jgi:hypothetical protein
MKYKINKKRLIIGSIIFVFLFVFLFFPLDTPQILFIPGLESIKSFIRKKSAKKDVLMHIEFSEKESLKEWKNRVFRGKTIYEIERQGDELFLGCKSKNSASALYRLLNYNSKEYPILSWRWRAKKFPNKDGISEIKFLDDYALRIDVIFASGFFTNFRCIEYVWDDKLQEGVKLVSPYSDKIVQLVLRKGQTNDGWISEERNIYEDYISFFGEKPKLDVRAIAVMSDSEGTKDSSEGDIKEMKVTRK